MTTPDLYAALDLPRSASRFAIRAAYRRKSKESHPDMPGGSEKRFDLIKLAHDTLTDESRRRHYNETGEAGEKPVDNKRAEALQCVAACLEACLAECQSSGTPPETIDLVARMRSWIRSHMAESDREINRIYEVIAKNEALGRRFKGEVMQAIIAGRIAMLNGAIASKHKHRDTGVDALELLEPVTFDAAEPPPQQAQPKLAQMLNQMRF